MHRSTLAIGLVVLSLSSSVYALDPLGAPKALLGRNHWSLGIEYAYSETDTELTGIFFGGEVTPDVSSKSLKANRVYVTPRYGVLENLDVFVRLGALTLETPVLTAARFEGDTDLAWGIGAAATVYDSERFDWGVIVQWSRGESEADSINPTMHFRSEMEVESFQVATGPTYQFREDLNLYGGGFYHSLDGEYRDNIPIRFDMEEDSSFGGFVGLDWMAKDDALWNVELQHTGTAFGIATGLRWVF